jgi:acyl-CoA synthetase (AMP-forming)/AMP-acid ligase II
MATSSANGLGTPAGPGRGLLLGDVFRRNGDLLGDAPAAWLEEASLSHAELDLRADRFVHALRAEGLGHGDRVVVWADTCLEVLPLFVACARMGAIFAPVNARLSVDEAADVCALARPDAMFGDAANFDALAGVAGRLGVGRVGGLQGGGRIDLADAAGSGPVDRGDEPALRETDPHVLFFTSGSTGRPKGVVLSHRASWLRSFQGPFRDESERTVCMFPLFHMAPYSLGLAAWQTRGSIAFVHSPTPEALLSAVERIGANRFYGIPLVWSRVLAHLEEVGTGRYDLSTLRELDTGTSAVPIELVRALKERFPGTRTRIYYGSTEVGSAACLPDALVLEKPGSVGPASPATDLRLTDEGEICVRSPFLCDGYFDNEAATGEALQDGWFHTGDLGALDADGFLSIIGRKKEIIRSGGESVAPSEVEAALADVPGVHELAIVGVPDPEWGETVTAIVVEQAGAEVTLDVLRAACEGQLAGFKKPRRLVKTKALPRTVTTGQVQRALLVEQIQTGVIQ